MRPLEDRHGKIEEDITPDDRIREQDEMIKVLLEAGGSSSLMDQPNATGKTPRQLLEETRARWRLNQA